MALRDSQEQSIINLLREQSGGMPISAEDKYRLSQPYTGQSVEPYITESQKRRQKVTDTLQKIGGFTENKGIPFLSSYSDPRTARRMADKIVGGVETIGDFLPGSSTALAKERGDKFGEAVSYLDLIPGGAAVTAPIKVGRAVLKNKGITALKTKPRERTSKEVLKQNFIEEHPPVGSIDNKTGNPVTQQLIKTRANAFENGLSIPAVRRREELRIYNNTNPQIIAPERNIKTPEDLLGKVLVPVVGDRSAVAAGGIIDIKGVPLSQRIPIQGGPNYMIENAGTGKGWASMEDNANKKQMNMIFAADETGLDPYGVYSAMGRESINFSAPVATSMIAQLPALNIPKKQIKAFNDTIKKGIGKSVKPRPDFVGLDSDEIFNQMLGTGKFDRKGAGTLRTIVVEEMKKPRWQNMGFPLYDDVLKTINEPSLMDIKTGESGLGIFKGDPSKSTFPELTHQSYDTAIPGEYFGGLQESVPPEIMFPKTFETMSKRINSGGVPFPYQDQVGSLMMNPKLYEVADDQYVDQLIKYMNKNKGTNYATGGAVRSGIAAIATA